ncbi:hypothetical protein CANINC_003869 [Pichia inconspicua]|uniref:MutL C-terminal dimerisation domain-containing protein n=1 Tax=Pichia inconspicua TaxID=52247 RepID=A0A4T0WXZ6_9ASCO|nr:hypothetical protein CANINC_003869 [[Candida] inconspicua]
MSNIKELSHEVNSLLKSQIILKSLADVVREMVQNGIDAHAQSISLRLDVDLEKDLIVLNCLDDGKGIHPDSLSKFGKRFYTSKLEASTGDKPQGLAVLKTVDTFGFRGETMHALRNLCDTVIVVSRVKEYSNGFKACFSGDSLIGNIVKSDKVVKVGTNIKLIGLFDKVKVRKKLLLDTLKKSWIKETFEIRKAILDGIIKCPFTNIEIERNVVSRGNNTKRVMVKCNSKNLVDKVPLQPQMYVFNTIFDGICTEYEICKVKYKEFELKVGIGISTTQNKNYQFIYLNDRPFCNADIFKQINDAFQRNYDLWGDDIRMEEHGKIIRAKNNMFGKPYSVNPIFLAVITAPVEVSELIQDPSKVCFTSKNEKIFLSLFNKAIEIFFGLFSKRKSKEVKPIAGSMKIEKTSKVRKDKVILHSNVRMSDMLTHELNGRLHTSETVGKYQDRHFDFQKIQKGLLDPTQVRGDVSKYKISKCDEMLTDCNSCLDIGTPLSQSEARKTSEFFNKYSHDEIAKNDVRLFELIGQVDNKFILVRFENRIIGLDQHASDERINLEKMYERLITDAVLQKYYKLDEVILLNFDNEEEIELLQQYKSILKIWGILFEKIDKLKTIQVTHLTIMVAQRVSKDFDILRKGIIEYIYNIEKGTKKAAKLEVLKGLHSEGNHDVNLIMQNYCPAKIVETAKSRACRSAIMFGDHLSRDEQRRLIDQLGSCQDPFRCAHGRPSLYPLCVLEQ